ncbi:MAG: bifunctional UDP-sugar hydrolase/5'-nucleotidase [Ignavibacteriaceae bacterium]
MFTKFKLLVTVLFLSAVVLIAQTRIKIVVTSDVHGRIFPYDLTNDRKTDNSLAQVMTYLNEQRNSKNEELILLDNGDILQGDPVVYYSNYIRTDVPHIISRVYNYMGYDAATIGNHDIEAGHPVYDRIIKEMNIPWLAANAMKNDSSSPYFTPYKIVERGGIKVAVIGMITPYLTEWLPEKLWEGMYFEDMIESARKWVSIVKEKENPDVIVGLFHSGLDYNYGNQNEKTYKNENAVELVAKQVDGFDVIFSGHDHKVVNKMVNKTLIVGPGSHAGNVGVANILLDDGKTVTGEIVSMKEYKADESFINELTEYFRGAREFVSKEIGTLEKSITTRDAYFGNSDFVDLIHRVQLDNTKADVSFAAPLSFDVTLKAGKLYVRDMFNLYKYENFLYTIELTGEEILKYLEFSYSKWFNTIYTDDDLMLNLREVRNENNKEEGRVKKYQFAVPFYNLDYAAGIDYEVDITKKPGERVTIKSLSNGEKFETDKKYLVTLNSYRGNGGGGHLTFGSGLSKEELLKRVRYSSETDFRKHIIDWIEKEKTIKPFKFNNWKVVPENIFRIHKEREYELLFGVPSHD